MVCSWKAGGFSWSLELLHGAHRKKIALKKKVFVEFIIVRNLDQDLGSESPRVNEYGYESREKSSRSYLSWYR